VFDGRLEQSGWLAGVPFLEAFVEIMRHNVSRDASEGYGALAPLLEAKVELVVLDPSNPRDVFLGSCQRWGTWLDSQAYRSWLRTARAWPPRWFATALAIDGFSATHSTRVMTAQGDGVHVDEARVRAAEIVGRQAGWLCARQPQRRGRRANGSASPHGHKRSANYERNDLPGTRTYLAP